ncbi:cation-transporting P-type ATPase [Nitriliruptoraceae bacterium ZYF776]|nr:cation-transporting P-type ATPase [Profundirhabdus halotolerans]
MDVRTAAQPGSDGSGWSPPEPGGWAGAAAEEVLRALGSRPSGLTGSEVETRAAQAGPNRLEAEAQPHLVRAFVGNVTHLMALLLWVGGGLAFAAGLPQLGVAVWVVNLVNGAFSTWQEHRAERAVEALRGLMPARARIRRDGVDVEIDAVEVVPGDVLVLAEGDRVPADGRLLSAHALRVDQSTLTGESRPVHRSADPPSPVPTAPSDQVDRVFAGTTVTVGHGTAVVTATGMGTEFGAIADLTRSMVRERSPLQVELDRVSRVVAAIAVGVGTTFFLVAQLTTDLSVGRGLVFALGMIVAFVPEGLLPTVTLALAMGTQRMARRQALVKRLSAVEALGSTTVICTDKTGTLTANQMTVRTLVTADGAAFELTGTGYEPEGELRRDGRRITTPPQVAEVLRTGLLANDAHLVAPTTSASTWGAVGDPTESALLVAAAKAGLDTAEEGARAPRLAEHPFDPVRKRMSTVHGGADGPLLRCKGAPRLLLERCSRFRDRTGDVPLTVEERTRILGEVEELARQGLRVLGCATRRLAAADLDAGVDAAERDLTWLGAVAMFDPPRPAVAGAIATCRRAGIRVVMITGDDGATGESIARQVGIVGPTEHVRVVDGEALDHLDDAPALKRADIGVAMGRSGTDVAREAADLVLLDDDFSSIVAAVEEGRAVYENVRKFTGYIFTSNTPEAVPFVVFGLSGGRIPIALDVMHILAVDLGTDLVPALGLGAEPPEPGLMDRPPRRRDEHLITGQLLRRSYLWLGPLQAAVVMGVFLLAYRAMGVDAAWTDLPASGPTYAAATAAALAAVVATQVGNLLAHRTELASVRTTSWRGNRLLWIGVASEVLVILAIVYLPPLQRVIGTAPFPGWLWLVLLAVSPTLLVADEARKWLVRRRPTSSRPTSTSSRPTSTSPRSTSAWDAAR